jgi:hypothetical protein
MYGAGGTGVIFNTVNTGGLQIVGGNTTSDGANMHLGGSAGDSDFFIRIGTSEKFRVDSSGNVGIGTANPGAKLHIKDTEATLTLGSNLSEGVTTNTPIGRISFTSDDSDYGTNYEVAGIRVISSNLYGLRNDMLFFTRDQATLSERMRIDWNGNVGIGTTAPNAPLTIVSSGVSGGNITFRSDRTDSTIFENSYSLNMKSANGLNFDYDGNLNGGGAFNVYEGATSRFYIAGSSGNVGIGTTAPGYKLDVAGDIRAVSFIYSSSDRSLKKNITTISNPLDKISQLRGVTFDWKSNNEASIGLIAQEVEKVYPELVKGDDGSKAIQYSGLIAPLIEAVKEQQREINNLETRLQILEAK